VALNSLGDYKEAALACSIAIKIDGTAVKAWYQRSVANRKQNEYGDAMNDLKVAIRLSP
jgi:tetratricopeptide (TPR) repeat protein